MFGIDDAISGLTNLAGSGIKAAMDAKFRGQAADTWNEYIDRAKNLYGLDPEKAAAFLKLQDKSAYESMDPVSRDQANEATRRLLETGSGSGLDTMSRVALNQGISQSGAAARAARQAVMQDYAQRGTSGSGAELGAALAGAQQSYGDLANATGTAAAAAQQRRLEANTLASRAAQQQQQLEQQKASALDALQRFNVSARQNVLGQQQQAMQTLGQGYSGKANAYGGFANNLNTSGNPWSGAVAAAGNVASGLAKGLSNGGEPGSFGPPSINNGGSMPNSDDWLAKMSQKD